MITVSPPTTPPSFFPTSLPPLHSISTLVLSLRIELASKSKWQNNKIKHNKIKLKPSPQFWASPLNKRKDPQSRNKNQRPTHSHTQEYHKNTNLKSINTLFVHREPGADLRRPYACCFSLWVHISLTQLTQRALFSWHPLFPLTLILFLSYLRGDSLSSERRDSMETSHFELCVPRILSTVHLWVFASVLVCCRKKPLHQWLNKALIYEYSRISLRLILFIVGFLGQQYLVLS